MCARLGVVSKLAKDIHPTSLANSCNVSVSSGTSNSIALESKAHNAPDNFPSGRNIEALA